MKTLKSILLGTFIAVGGIALAMNAKTQESICTQLNHQGYSYTGTPPVNSSPDNLPTGMTPLNQYGPDFRCDVSEARCHWAYIPAVDEETPGRWVECKGDLKLPPFTD